MAALTHLFTPLKIKNLQLRNRIVMPAMHLGYCDNGRVTQKLIDFYAVRAAGGVGLIIVGGCAIDEHGYPSMIRISDDSYLEGLSRLTAAVHAQGAAIAAQLFQPGRYSYSFLFGIQPVAPSPIPSKLTRQVPRELTVEEIKGIINSFARAAARAKAAGFDAVEVIASAGYLISQFLSPLTNQRQDEYGGDFERRMRFGLEVADAIRQAVGPDYPVIFRVGGSDFMPGGNTNNEIRLFCKALVEHGVDMINVTGGWHETLVPQITMAVPRGAYVYLANRIKREVSVPVVACNRINDPLLAERVLREGLADLVGMARALIADPEMPLKAQAGRFEEIRPCIGCNQGCLDAVFTNQAVKCLVNAAAGREGEYSLKPAAQKKTVLVLGGGPGGMEAARVAAARGHRVVLWEKSDRLGGQLNLAAVPPGREEFGTFRAYLENEIKRLGVEVHLNKEATADEVLSFNADAVIVATGAQPIKPSIPGIELPHVVQAWDVLAGKAVTGKRVVIVGGGAVGCETALYLARIGTIDAETFYFLALNRAETPEMLQELALRGNKEVTVVEMLKSVGADIGVSTRWIILQEMHKYGIKALTSTKVVEIVPGGVKVEKDGETKVIEADTVVLAVGSRAVSELGEEIKEKVKEIYMVGDAVSPRKVLDAVYDGFLAGSVV